jgi:aminomethyltransferase
MPRPTPFHPRTREACITHRWKDWAGYLAPCSYGLSPEREYNAVRQACGLLDVTPLFKYDIQGPDAGDFLSFLTVRSVRRMRVGRVAYLCWCDGDGKVLDDGTCTRLGADHYRLTSAAPALHWLTRHAAPFDVSVQDLSAELAALALQGPTSRALLGQVCDADLDELRYFGATATRFASGPGWITRTGFTGDLGYELWVPNAEALPLWDELVGRGAAFGLEPIGLDTLDILRIEAGFVLRGVDYTGANEAHIGAQRSSPFELGLGWTVRFKGRDDFLGREALLAEKQRGSEWALVGIDIDWFALEAAFDALGLPPGVPHAAWREVVPLFRRGRQIGRATSGAWSPTLKRNLALATVEADCARPGTELEIDWMVEWQRRRLPAKVTPTPFFDPTRKRA